MTDPVAGISLRGIVVGNGDERELIPYYKVPFTQAEFHERRWGDSSSEYKAIFTYPNPDPNNLYPYIPQPLLGGVQAILRDNWMAGGNIATYMQDATPGKWHLLKDDAPSTVPNSSFDVVAGDIDYTDYGRYEVTWIRRVLPSNKWSPSNVSRLVGPQDESVAGSPYDAPAGEHLPTLMIADSSGVLFRLTSFMYANSSGWTCWLIANTASVGHETDYDTVHIKDLTQPDTGGTIAMTRYDPRAQTGTIGIYLLDKHKVADWTRDLWETDLVETIRTKFIGDGRNAVLGLRWFFGLTAAATDQLAVREAEPIQLGNIAFEVTGPTSSEDWVVYDFGSVTVAPFFGDHRDYSITTYSAYLPFVGVITLDPNDIVGENVSLAYAVNITDGSALVVMFTGSAFGFPNVRGNIFTTTTTWGYDIPLQIDSVPDKDTAVLSMLSRVGGAAAGGAALGGAPGALVGGALGLISSPAAASQSYSTGILAPNANAAGDFEAKIIVHRHSDLTGDLEGTLGAPSGDTMLVSEASGYLQVAAVVNSGQLAELRRGDEIIAMLKEGVYI